MLRLMIVEDERPVREALANSIKWESLGIELSAICANGIEAYHSLLDDMPDIILTDIRMPVISGLELIERTTKLNSETEFIILSGFSDFEYAQQAIQLGVSNYLLKPCGSEKLMEAIQKAMRNLREKIRQKEAIHILHQRNQSMQLVLLQKILRECIEIGKVPASLPESYPILMEQNISCYIQTIPVQHIHQISPDRVYKENDFLVTIQGDQTLYLISNYPVSLPDQQGRYQFNSQYECLVKLVQLISQHEIIVILDGGERIRIPNKRYIFEKIDNLDPTQENEEAVYYLLENCIDAMPEIHQIKALLAEFILKRKARNDSEWDETHRLEKLNMLQECTCHQQLKQMLQRIVCIHATAIQNASGNEVIDKCTAYIDIHYDDSNLSLKWMATEYLFMNADYLGRLFHRILGVKFSTYLAETRIRNARKLLDNSDLSVAEVADSVGCGENPQYFSYLFKKLVGVSPKAYASRSGK